MKTICALPWELTTLRDFEPPVMHRVCAWCRGDLGDVPCAPADLGNAGKTSHGICESCKIKLLEGLHVTEQAQARAERGRWAGQHSKHPFPEN